MAKKNEIQTYELPQYICTEGSTTQRFHASNAPLKGIRGPRGCGKSGAVVFEILSRANEQEPASDGVRYTRVLAVRNTFPQLLSSTVVSWTEWVPETVYGEKWCPITRPMNSSPTGHMRVPRVDFATGAQDGTSVDLEILFISLDKPEDAKKLQGTPATFFWFNELGTMPAGSRDIIDQARASLNRFPSGRWGTPTYSAVLFDTNPPDTDHFFYDMAEKNPVASWDFFQQPPAVLMKEGMKHGDKDPAGGIYGPYMFNPKCENQDYYNRSYAKRFGPNNGWRYWMDLTLGTTQNWIKVFLMNQYGSVMRNKPVFWRYDDDKHCAKYPVLALRGIPLYIGADYGGTPALVICQQGPGGQLRVLDEITTGYKGCTTEGRRDLRQTIKEFLKPLLANKYAGLQVKIIGDPIGGAQKSQSDSMTCNKVMREEFGHDNVIVHIPYGWQDRIMALDDYLQRTVDKGVQAFHLSPDCSMIRRALIDGYCYPKISSSAEERATPDKNTKYSHIMDAIMAVAIYSKKRPVQWTGKDDAGRVPTGVPLNVTSGAMI